MKVVFLQTRNVLAYFFCEKRNTIFFNAERNRNFRLKPLNFYSVFLFQKVKMANSCLKLHSSIKKCILDLTQRITNSFNHVYHNI